MPLDDIRRRAEYLERENSSGPFAFTAEEMEDFSRLNVAAIRSFASHLANDRQGSAARIRDLIRRLYVEIVGYDVFADDPGADPAEVLERLSSVIRMERGEP